MSGIISNKIVKDGLIFYLDAANTKSFLNTSSGWNDIMDNYGTLSMSGATYESDGLGSIAFSGGSASNLTMKSYENTTWEIWIKKTTNPSVGLLGTIFGHSSTPYLAFRSNGTLHFSYKLNVGGVNTQYNLYTASGITSPTGTLYTWNDNVWYNIVCTLSMNISIPNLNSDAKIYVNGIEIVASTTLNNTSNQLPTYNKISIGDMGGDHPFNGKVSNVKIYNRILSSSEIVSNYNTQSKRFLS